MSMTFQFQITPAMLVLVRALCLSFRAVAADDLDSGPPAPMVAQTVAPETSAAKTWSVHGQLTNVTQWHPGFKAPYSGADSLDPHSSSAETTDLTLYLGTRLWQGGELYINPEIDQGFGLSNTLGIAGFPSGEANKVGASSPYLRLQRTFLRQIIGLGGAAQNIEAGANRLGGSVEENDVTVTLGKFSVTDLFDANTYAHDPRADFLNWSIIDAGAFDYAADAWGDTRTAWQWNGPNPGGRCGAVASISQRSRTAGCWITNSANMNGLAKWKRVTTSGTTWVR
jgi:high affinity Mn2+ porin